MGHSQNKKRRATIPSTLAAGPPVIISPTRRALAARNRCQDCCDACKRLHRKCDNGAPCGTCIQKKRECTRGRSPSPSSSDPNSDIIFESSNAPSPSSEGYSNSLPNTPSSTTLTIDDSYSSPMTKISELFGDGTFRVAMDDAHLFIYNKDERVFRALVDDNNQLLDHMDIGSQRDLAQICQRVTSEELINPVYYNQFPIRGAGHADPYNFSITHHRHHQQHLF